MTTFSMEIHKPSTRPDVAVVRLTGTLDSFTLQEFEKAIQDLLKENRFHLVMNCQRLRYISSSGMGIFLGTLGEVEKQGGSISLMQVNEPEVHDAMNLLGFFDIFPVYQQESEAIQKAQKK